VLVFPEPFSRHGFQLIRRLCFSFPLLVFALDCGIKGIVQLFLGLIPFGVRIL
jgi:hypothetical protein